MSDRKSVGEMVAELLREAGLLTAVFLPIDLYVLEDNSLTLWSAAGIIVVPRLLIVLGILLELKRK